MKFTLCIAIILTMFTSCLNLQNSGEIKKETLPIQGTWKLLTGTTSDKTGTVVTNYTKDKSFIKIINDTHFAFLGHDIDKGKDSSADFFSSGGGKYTLNDSNYTEHLEYCNDRQWEGNDFNFSISIHDDTLIQKGIEKIDSLGINRINIEKYIRLKN